MNERLLSNLEGFRASKRMFTGFTIQEILIEYEQPLLLVARSPKGEQWLFKWCDSVDSSGIDIWVALWISENRLSALKNNSLSLREAVNLPEKKFYVFEAEKLFEPISILRSFPEKLPKDCVPSDDLSINGEPLRPPAQKGDHLTVRFHVISDYFSEGNAPLAIISPLQIGFQEYMTWTAHAIRKTPQGRIPSSFEDWSGFNLTAITKGSFKMECKSNSDSKQTKLLTKACELLADLSNGTKEITSIEEAYSKEFGSGIIHHLFLLAELISNLQLSLTISWESSDNSRGFLALDKRKTNNIINSLGTIDRDAFLREITIELTSEEAEPIRRKVNGIGGMQNLLRNLQSKLKPDNTIKLSPNDIEKILRYGLDYGQGGFQNRLVGIAKALKRVSISFYPHIKAKKVQTR